MEKEILDFGWANGWKETPREIVEAKEKGFKTKDVGNCGRCRTVCQIETDTQILRWRVDSSD